MAQSLDEGMVALPEDDRIIMVPDEGTPAPDSMSGQAAPGDFYANMVDALPEATLDELGSDLVEAVNNDEQARSEWMETFKASIEATGKHGGVSPDEGQNTGLVKHVLLNEARMHAHARLMAEMNPAGSQQKFTTIGPGTPETRDMQDRLSEFSNYQLNNTIEGWNDTISRHFTYLTLTGTSYLKTCWDDRIGAPQVIHVSPENLILSPDTMDLRSSKRYTHKFNLTVNEYNKMCRSGYYRFNAEVGMEGGTAEQEHSLEVTGIHVPGDGSTDTEQDDAKKSLTFYDVYTTCRFPGFHEFMDDGPDVESPYIVTVEKSSQKIVRVVPNWQPDDPIVRNPIQSIIMFKFLDGTGPTGDGIYNVIGGLDKAATSALRANLDAAAKSLNRAMFVGPNVRGGRIAPKPGELIKVKRGDKIRDSFFEQPVMPPDQTMLALLGTMSEEARRIMMTTDFQVGDAAKANMPVGTVTALIAQGQIALTGIHQRVHAKMAEVFKQLMRLNYLYQPDFWEFTATGRNIVMYREDFNPTTVDVIPASDPNVASQTMRMAQMQDVYSLAVNHPDLMDMKVVLDRLMKVNKIPDHEEFFTANEPPPYLDPVSENIRAMHGEAIMAYDEQDHESHLKAHLTFFQDPSLADNAFGEQARQVLYGHIIEHMGMFYRQRIMAGINMPITGEPLPPEQEMMISTRVAELLEQAPQIIELRDVMTVGGDPAVETAQQLAQLELEIKQAEAQQNRDIKQQQALDDLQAKRAKLQSDLQIEQIKAESKVGIERANTAVKVENMRLTHQQQTQMAVEEARQEMRQDHEKHIQEMRQEYEKHRLEMREELEKARVEIETLKAKAAEQKKSWLGRSKETKSD